VFPRNGSTNTITIPPVLYRYEKPDYVNPAFFYVSFLIITGAKYRIIKQGENLLKFSP